MKPTRHDDARGTATRSELVSMAHGQYVATQEILLCIRAAMMESSIRYVGMLRSRRVTFIFAQAANRGKGSLH